MSPEKRRARGYAAKVLIEDETLSAAWNELEAELRDQWEASLFPRKRDRIWTELRHLKALRTKLAGYARHAKD